MSKTNVDFFFFFSIIKTSNYCPIWQNEANVEA